MILEAIQIQADIKNKGVGLVSHDLDVYLSSKVVQGLRSNVEAQLELCCIPALR